MSTLNNGIADHLTTHQEVDLDRDAVEVDLDRYAVECESIDSGQQENVIDDSFEDDDCSIAAVLADYARMTSEMHASGESYYAYYEYIDGIKQDLVEQEDILRVQQKEAENKPIEYHPGMFHVIHRLEVSKHLAERLSHKVVAANALLPIVKAKFKEMVSEVDLIECMLLRRAEHRQIDKDVKYFGRYAPSNRYYVKKVCKIDDQYYLCIDTIEVLEAGMSDPSYCCYEYRIPNGAYATLEAGKKAFLSNNEDIEKRYKAGKLTAMTMEKRWIKNNRLSRPEDPLDIQVQHIENLGHESTYTNRRNFLITGTLMLDDILHTVQRHVTFDSNNSEEYHTVLRNFRHQTLSITEKGQLRLNNSKLIDRYKVLIDRLVDAHVFCNDSVPIAATIAQCALITPRKARIVKL